ncbi:MAG TPA: hypothetical protein VGB03_00310 [Acidimicrobiales bacterium]|jgi:hypothetical protein
MHVVPTDPRDTTWEIDFPAYRVYFRVPGGGPWDEYEVRDADVDEVLAWAAGEAGGREYCVYVVVPDPGGKPGMIRLRGATSFDFAP